MSVIKYLSLYGLTSLGLRRVLLQKVIIILISQEKENGFERGCSCIECELHFQSVLSDLHRYINRNIIHFNLEKRRVVPW